MPAFLNALRFVDVDPRSRVLDDAAVRAIVTRVTEVAVAGSLESKTFAPGWHHNALGTAIEQALAEALGPWCTAFTFGDGRWWAIAKLLLPYAQSFSGGRC
jgi:hypothetical protein